MERLSRESKDINVSSVKRHIYGNRIRVLNKEDMPGLSNGF